MTTSPNPDDPDTEGKTLPPYDDRQEGGDVDAEGSTKDDAKTGGATGPVEDDQSKASDPERTDRGGQASPADEQPASEVTTTDTDPDMTGPGHTEGTGRAEDKS